MFPALIDNLGGVELLIVLVAGLLVFGRRLPEVAGQAGRQLVKVRRSLDAAWRETGMEKELRDVKRDLDTAIPRDLSIADMARIASAEMDKRVKANEESALARATAKPDAPKDADAPKAADEPVKTPVDT